MTRAYTFRNTYPKRELTPEVVKELFEYNEVDGVLIWAVNRPGHPKGSIAGSLNPTTMRWQLKVFGKNYARSRLVFAWKTGRWPCVEVDHRDLDKLNDRWDNLREATQSQNRANVRVRKSSGSGLKGVVFRPARGGHHGHSAHYEAAIRKDGVKHFLGNFATAEEAHKAYVEAAARLHGDFARFK